MEITLTAEEMLNRGLWDMFCELRGISVWAINEGQVDSKEKFTLTEEESRKLGLSTFLSF